MLDYVEIEGFKTLKKVNLKLEPLNILIGGNGSGKSNLLSFFTFLGQLYDQNLQDYIAQQGGIDKFLHKGRKVTQEIVFKLPFNNKTNGYGVVLRIRENTLYFAQEVAMYNNNNWEIGKKGLETELANNDLFRSEYIRKHILSCRRYHFHDTSDNSMLKSDSSIDKNNTLFLYSDGRNLAAYLYRIMTEDPKVYRLILSAVHSVAPFLVDFDLVPNAGQHVELNWRAKGCEVTFGPHDFSDGTLRFIALTVLFLQPKLPDTIVIDEPELGLHPAAVASLAGLMRSAAARGTQVIAATQSAELINHFNPEDVVTVDLVDGESKFQRLSSVKLDSWLEMYSLGEIWQRSIISQGQPQYR